MANRYNKEYEQYYIYALEQFLINTYGYSEYDAKVKVMQDFEEVKEDFEMKEKWNFESFDWRKNEYWGDTDQRNKGWTFKDQAAFVCYSISPDSGVPFKVKIIPKF